MIPIEQQLVEKTKARYSNARTVEVYPHDPREVDPDGPWSRGTYQWFPFKRATHTVSAGFEDIVVIWCECGYGHYALEVNGEIVGMGKNVMHGAGYTLVGESHSQDGLMHLSHDVTL